MTQIHFRLPMGSPRFHPERMSDDSRAHGSTELYEHGLDVKVNIPPGMRVPVVGETVTVPGSVFEFTVHAVHHYYGPDTEDALPHVPTAYVVLR